MVGCIWVYVFVGIKSAELSQWAISNSAPYVYIFRTLTVYILLSQRNETLTGVFTCANTILIYDRDFMFITSWLKCFCYCSNGPNDVRRNYYYYVCDSIGIEVCLYKTKNESKHHHSKYLHTIAWFKRLNELIWNWEISIHAKCERRKAKGERRKTMTNRCRCFLSIMMSFWRQMCCCYHSSITSFVNRFE